MAFKSRNYRGRSLPERQARRREQLIDAGIVVFGRHGFSGATVKAICRQARLTERYFYESFASRERLFAEVYQQLTDDLHADIERSVAAEQDRAEEMARAGLRTFFQTMHDRPDVARILLIEIFGISAEINELYRNATRDFTVLLRDTVAPMFPMDADDDLNQDLLATGLVGSTLHIAMAWVLTSYQLPRDVVVENALSFYTALFPRVATPA